MQPFPRTFEVAPASDTGSRYTKRRKMLLQLAAELLRLKGCYFVLNSDMGAQRLLIPMQQPWLESRLHGGVQRHQLGAQQAESNARAKAVHLVYQQFEGRAARKIRQHRRDGRLLFGQPVK